MSAADEPIRCTCGAICDDDLGCECEDSDECLVPGIGGKR